jgi:TrmH family RNA methyltransferase
MAQALKKYMKKFPYSYTLGAFPTFELVKNQPQQVEAVYLHSMMDSPTLDQEIRQLCAEKHVRCIVNDKIVEKLREKENCFVIGVFNKYEQQLEKDTNHIVLVNPSDMGNMGTIMRTSLGFGIRDLAIIQPAVDIFNPKVLRASMGAVFQMNCRYYNSFDEYVAECGERSMYPFMLGGTKYLQDFHHDSSRKFSLIFGNEATGLDPSFKNVGEPIMIRHNNKIDSLNLSMAVGIALYEFTK